MRFQELHVALQITEDEVSQLHEAFTADTGVEDDFEAFLQWLHHQGALPDEVYQQFMSAFDEPTGTLAPVRPPEPVAEPIAEPELAAAPVAETSPAEPSAAEPAAASPPPEGDDDPPTEPPANPIDPGPQAARSPYDDDDDDDDDVRADAPHNVSRFVPFAEVQARMEQDKAAETAAEPAEPAKAEAPPRVTAATTMMPPPPPNVRTANPAPARESGPSRPRGTTGQQSADAAPKSPTGSQKAPTGPQKAATGSQKAATGPQKAATGPQKAPTGSQTTGTGSQRPGTGSQKPGTGPQKTSRAPTMPLGSRAPEGASTEHGTPEDVPGRGYRFVGKIGEGAMGEILIAKDLDLHRSVAYKVMSKDIQSNPELSGKFYGEAQITAQLDHPNIVPVYALGRHPNGTLSYTMKQIRGKTFEKLVEETKEQYRGRKIDVDHTIETRLDMFLKVLDAMYYAHTRGVVHRDLKPENIMVGAFGEVYVMDWGIARLFDVAGARREDLVLVEGYQEWEGPPPEEADDDEDDEIEGVIIGTPQYMSPEQAYGRRDIDGKSDQYALGLILFELVSMRQAVTGKSPQKIVLRQQDGYKEPLTHLFNEPIAPELRAIIEKSTQKKIELRYADVRAMADDIRRYQHGEAVLAKPDTIRQAVSRWVGKHRELTLFAVFGFLSLSAFTVFVSVVYTLYSGAVQRQHEQALTQLLTQAGAQASVIDGNFARYRGQLGIVAASALEMLIRGEPTTDALYTSADFSDPAKAPPDLDSSKRYQMPISVQYPVVFQRPDAPRDAAEAFHRLTPATRYLRRVMLLSHSEEASSYTPKRAERLISDVGTPLAYVSIGLVDGGYIGYPGHAGIPDNFDVTKTPWFKLAEGKKEATWGSPFIDPGSLGLLLPCSIGLFDEEDKPKFLGVASVQLPFDYIIEKLLLTEGLPPGAESFLVDDEGKIVVRSSEKGKKFDAGALRTRSIRMPDFPVPAVIEGIKAKDSGRTTVYEDGESDLVLYNRMNSLGWYYVIRGEESALLGR